MDDYDGLTPKWEYFPSPYMDSYPHAVVAWFQLWPEVSYDIKAFASWWWLTRIACHV